MEEVSNQLTRGGEFLVAETPAETIFIAEDWDEEQLMMAQTCKDFLEAEIYPNLDRIDKQEEGLMQSLLDKSGQLGMLGVSIPEEYGGFGKDVNTGLLVNEATGSGHSFAVASAAHTGIGTLPILYYGTEDQKKKYLPDLASGKIKGCYCLTEPNSGSDANSGKTKAVLSADKKHYVINGQKMWITNGGFADLFIVFAKIDDDKTLSAFIVEKGFGGIDLNEEEVKMGIKGSSTRQVFFNDCKIPVENLLGKREEGFKIALNILNIGRIKLAAAALGGCKKTNTIAINYAKERSQFGTQIANFGAIKYKLAEMAIKSFASESALYRTGFCIDRRVDQMIDDGMDPIKAKMKAVEDYAAECAIMKVHGSETLDYVVDEGVQIFGGMGFSAEAPMDRAYRDARINRIFEGTNEINRLLTVDMLLKKALKGEIDLMGPAQAVQKELTSVPDFSANSDDGSFFSKEIKTIRNLKKAILMVAGYGVQKYMQALEHEQEILMNAADMIMEVFISESTVLRVKKLVGIRGEEACKHQIEMAKVYLNDAVDRVNIAGKNAITSMAEGDEQKMMLMGLKRFTKSDPINVKELRRSIANKLIEENKYCF